MRVPSNILGVFKDHDGTMDPRDGVLEVPRVLMPITQLPQPAVSVTALGTTVYNNTVLFSIDTVNTGAAAQVTDLFALARGLWEICITFYYHSDITGGGINGRVTLQIGTASAQSLVSAASIANQPVTFDVQRVMALAAASQIRAVLDPPGVGQNNALDLAFLCNRLA